jgi:hypothetical protein
LPSRPASSRRSRSGRSPRLANPHSAMSDRGMRRLFDRLVALGGVRELTGRSTFRLAADDGGESLPRHRLGRCEDHGLDPHHEFPPAQGSGKIGQLAIEAGFWSGAPSHANWTNGRRTFFRWAGGNPRPFWSFARSSWRHAIRVRIAGGTAFCSVRRPGTRHVGYPTYAKV